MIASTRFDCISTVKAQERSNKQIQRTEVDLEYRPTRNVLVSINKWTALCPKPPYKIKSTLFVNLQLIHGALFDRFFIYHFLFLK